MIDRKSFFERVRRNELDEMAAMSDSRAGEAQDVVPELERVPDLQAVLGGEAVREPFKEPLRETAQASMPEPIVVPPVYSAPTSHPKPAAQESLPPTEPESVQTVDRISSVSQPASPHAAPDDEAQPLDENAMNMLDQIVGIYENTPLQSVEEIYRAAEIQQGDKHTIYIADRFMRALPDDLDEQVKRKTVHNILAISGIELDALLHDANMRVGVLDAVLRTTNTYTKELDRRDLGLILELEKRIRDLVAIRAERRNFRQDQTSLVEEELGKLNAIIRFLSPQ